MPLRMIQEAITTMTDKDIETQAPEENEQDPEREQAQVIITWFQHIQEIVQEQFPEYEVDGQIGNNPTYGPMFAFTLKKDEKSTACGFFLNEIMRNFQTNPNAGLWLSSFFVDLLRSDESHLLPILRNPKMKPKNCWTSTLFLIVQLPFAKSSRKRKSMWI